MDLFCDYTGLRLKKMYKGRISTANLGIYPQYPKKRFGAGCLGAVAHVATSVDALVSFRTLVPFRLYIEMRVP